MPLISELLKDKPSVTQRKLYIRFQRAVKAGELPALRLLSRFEIVGVKDKRQVADYAYTHASAEQVQQWISQQQTAPRIGGVTAEQVQQMSDEQLAALIQQTKPTKKRRARKEKAPTSGPQQVYQEVKEHPQE